MNPRPEPPKGAAPDTGKPSPLPRISAIRGRDREFLPAALEILETPPPPAPVAFMLTICAFFLAALIWSFYGHLDVHAVARGKVEVVGHDKVIEPIDTGRVVAINVTDGARVKAGQLLIKLDPTDALAGERAANVTMYANLAEVERRRFAVATVRSDMQSLDAVLYENPGQSDISKLVASTTFADDVRWAKSIPEAIRARQLAVLRTDFAQLAGDLADLDQQMAQKEATRERLQMSIAFQNSLIDTWTRLVETRQAAINSHVGDKISLYEAMGQLQKSQAELAAAKGELIEADAALKELQGQKTKVVAQFIAENENYAYKAARKADEARQVSAKEAGHLALTELKAPIDGIVGQLAVTTVGQAVTAGQQLMTISPSGGRLEVEALVSNVDIGFVKVGQEVSVKVDAFPFTRFGALHGTVERIAPRAVDAEVASRALANAVSGANAANVPTSGAPGRPASFVFPVTITLDQTAIKVGNAHIPISPGMTVTVEIRTRSRRVIDYLLSPLEKLSSEAARQS